MKARSERMVRTVLGAAGLALVSGAAVHAGQREGADAAEPRVIALFNMNDLEKRADGTTQPTKPEGEDKPQPRVRLVGGSVVKDGQSGVTFIDAEETEHEAGVAAAWDSGINDNPPNALLLAFQKADPVKLSARFDLRATSTGSQAFRLEYRTGGSGDFKTMIEQRKIPRDSRFHEVSFDLTKRAPELRVARRIELLWRFAPGTGGNGTTRVDNLQVTATEPGR